MTIARDLWQRLETLHAVTYFSRESIAAAASAGLRGFWMGYFGFRASPLGPVGPGAVEATFANFHPSMIDRALPDAWSYATPSELVEVRAAAAASALRARAPSIDDTAAAWNPLLAQVVAVADPAGRALFAANRRVEAFDDPVAQLWQHATTLREHRGDGHVAALVAGGVDGCEAHLLHIAEQRTAPEVVLDHRGWSAGDVEAALGRLRDRGLIQADQLVLTEAGRSLRRTVEETTDRLAQTPVDAALTPALAAELIDGLTAPAVQVVASGVLPFPNPMGLPSIGADGSA